MEAASTKAQQNCKDISINCENRNNTSPRQAEESHPKAVKEGEGYADGAQESMTSGKRKVKLPDKQEQRKKLKKSVVKDDPLMFSLKRKKLETSSSGWDGNMQNSSDCPLLDSKKVSDSEDHDGLIAGWPDHSHKLKSKLKDLKNRERKHHDRKKMSSRSKHEGSERSHEKSVNPPKLESLNSSRNGWKVLDNKLGSEKWEITDSGRLSPDSEFSALHSIGFQMRMLREDNWTVSSCSQTRDKGNGIENTKSKHSKCQEVTNEVGSKKELGNNVESTLEKYEPSSSRTLQLQKCVPGKEYTKEDPLEFMDSPSCKKQMPSHGSTDSLMDPDNFQVYSQDEDEGEDGQTKFSSWSTCLESRKDLSEHRPLRQPRSIGTLTNEECIDGNSVNRSSNDRREGDRNPPRGANKIQHSIKVVINRNSRNFSPTKKSRNPYRKDKSSLRTTPTCSKPDQFSMTDVYAVQNYSASVGNRETVDTMYETNNSSSSCSTPVRDEVGSEDVETDETPVVYTERTPTSYSNESSNLNSLGDIGSVMSLVPRSVQQKHRGAFSLETFQRRRKPVRSLQESPRKTEANPKSYGCSVSPVSSKAYSKVKWPRASLSYDKKSRKSLPAESLSWRREQLDFKPTWQTHFSKQCSYNVEAFENKKFKVGFIDTHCHLDFLFRRLQHKKSFADFKDGCEGDDKFPPSFEGCVAIFCEARTFHKIPWWTDFLNESGVWAAFGCHPHFADQFDEEAEHYLRMALSQSKTVALGEIGLDYSDKNSQSADLQKSVFKKQLKIALEMKKPLVIHCRDASEDCLKIMKKKVPRDYLIHRHCFTGDWEEASLWFQTFSNVYLGFTPLITSSSYRAVNIRDVASKMPLNRLLLETDTPYFRPQCLFNGLKSSSHPGMAIHVAAQVAALRSLDLEEVLVQVRKNTRKMYNI